MEDLETKAFAAYAVPRLWKRFVDDIIAVLMKKSGETLLQHLNNQHPKIKITMEAEKSRCLPFMDVSFTRRLDVSLTRDVYQKPTHTNRYVFFNSHHPETVKAGIVQGLADRAIKVCSDTETRDREFRRISLPWNVTDVRNVSRRKQAANGLSEEQPAELRDWLRRQTRQSWKRPVHRMLRVSSKRYVG